MWIHGRVVVQLSDRCYLVSNDQTQLAVKRNRIDLIPVGDSDTNTSRNADIEVSAVTSSQIPNLLEVSSDVPSVNQTSPALND